MLPYNIFLLKGENEEIWVMIEQIRRGTNLNSSLGPGSVL